MKLQKMLFLFLSLGLVATLGFFISNDGGNNQLAQLSGNTSTIVSPVADSNLTAGQSITMTCGYTASSGAQVWKVVGAWYNPANNTSGVFFDREGNIPSPTNGSYSQQVNIPSSAVSGQFGIQCIAYFMNPSTGNYDYSPANTGHWVNIVTATSTAPAAPTNLRQTNISSNQIDVAWNDNSNNETGLQIRISTTSNFASGTHTSLTLSANTTTHSFKDRISSSVTISPGTTYWIRVRAQNSIGSSTWSNTISVTTPQVKTTIPTAPTSLSATPVSGSQINLSWTNTATNAVSLTIQRATNASFSSGLTTLTSSLSPTATTFSSTGLSSSPDYYYRIRANNSAGSSDWVTTGPVKTFTPPGDPSNLTVTNPTPNSLTISWAAPSSSGTPTGYQIFRNNGGTTSINTSTPIATVNHPATGFTNLGLDEDTEYRYRIRAVNAGGSSALIPSTSSGESGRTTIATINSSKVLLPVEGASLTAGTTTTMACEYTVASGFTLHHIAAAHYNPANEQFAYFFEVPGNQVSGGNYSAQVTVPNIPPGQLSVMCIAYFRNLANDTFTDINTGHFVNITAPVTSTAPTAPTNLRQTSISPDQINVTWNDNSNNETSFQIRISTTSNFVSGTHTSHTLSANTTTHLFTNRLPGTTYWIRVRAQNSIGSSTWSNTISVTTPEQQMAPPNNPTNVSVTYRSASQIKLSWTNSTSSNIASYRVLRNNTSVGTVNHPTNTFTDSNVNATTSYEYKVVSMDSSGNQATTPTTGATTPTLSTKFLMNNSVRTTGVVEVRSNPEVSSTSLTQVSGALGNITNGPVWFSGITYWYVDFTSGSDGWVNENNLELNLAPNAPSNLSGGAVSATQINLTWNDNSNNETGFQLQRSTSSSFSSPVTTNISANTTSTQVGDLSASTLYYFRIRAANTLASPTAYSNWSNSFSISTSAPQVTISNPPTNVTVGSPTTSSLTISWTAPTSGSAPEGYRVFRDNQTTTSIVTVPANQTSYINDSLVSGTTYTYRVASYNSAGQSSLAPTSGVSGTTNDTPPPPPPTGQLMGLNGPVGPINTEDVNPGVNPHGATDYFIDCVAGNDSNSGTSMSSPWRSISKVFNMRNSSSLQPGTRFLFKRGCRYNDPTPRGEEGIIGVRKSGTVDKPITYMAYGSGTAPIISGMIPITGGWTQHQGSIWRTNVGANKDLKYLFIDSSPINLARHPNTGYLTASKMTPTSVTNSWVGSQPSGSLADGAVNIIVRDTPWSYRKLPVRSQSGQNLTFDQTGFCCTQWWSDVGWGFFLENKLSFLDTPGEWFYNKSTGDLYLWAPGNANPNNLIVEVTNQTRGIDTGWEVSNINFKNLILEGYSQYAVHLVNSRAVTFENMEVRYSDKAFQFYTHPPGTTNPALRYNVRNNYIHNIYNDGTWMHGEGGHIVEGNVFRDIATNLQLAANHTGWNMMGVEVGGNYIFRRNIVDNIGYIGVIVNHKALIEENIVSRSGVLLNDGGGIAFDHSDGLIIRKNIIKDLLFNVESMPSPLHEGYMPISNGIYWGNHCTRNTLVTENIIINVPNSGIWFDHTECTRGGDVSNSRNFVTNNTIYSGGRYGIGLSDYSYWGTFGGSYRPYVDDTVTGNKIYSINPTQVPLFLLHSVGDSNQHIDWGTINNNYYYQPFSNTKVGKNHMPSGIRYSFTLPEWRIHSGKDNNSSTTGYSLTDLGKTAKIFYNDTISPKTVNVGTGGCSATGSPLSGNQTIQPFGAIVVEYRNQNC